MTKRETALKIVTRLQQKNHQAFFVGGCVRDEILGVEPQDYDIATDAKAEQILKLFKRTVPVGIQFGVVRIMEGDFDFEVATFRKDGEYLDSRRPIEVTFSTAQEDVRRRDFTINGLLYDPVADKRLDYVGGLKDIKEQIIRAIGDPLKRFQEDKLRLLRAIRFSARLNYRIEENTWEAIKTLSHEINKVSVERIQEELIKIFVDKNNHIALDLLDQSGLLLQILPEISAMKGVEQPPQFHPEGDVFVHTKLALKLLNNPNPEVAIATLFHDIGKPRTITYEDRIRFNFHCEVGARMTNAILKKLKFSNDSRKKIVKYVKNHLRFKDVTEMRINKLKRFLREETFLDELELHRVDCLASHGILDNWHFCQQKLQEYEATQEHKTQSPLNGNDLIELGYTPGPQFKTILTAVEDAVLENTITDKLQAIEFVKQNFALK